VVSSKNKEKEMYNKFTYMRIFIWPFHGKVFVIIKPYLEAIRLINIKDVISNMFLHSRVLRKEVWTDAHAPLFHAEEYGQQVS